MPKGFVIVKVTFIPSKVLVNSGKALLVSADVTVAVNIVITTKPIRIHSTLNRRPRSDLGALSPYLHKSNAAFEHLERFSNDCRKTNTKAIISTNHNTSKQLDKPIKPFSNPLQLAQIARKVTRTMCSWFWFCFWDARFLSLSLGVEISLSLCWSISIAIANTQADVWEM